MFEYYSSLIRNRDTSYKVFLLKFIFQSVYRNKYNFTFKELSCGIVSSAWDFINEKGKRFTYHDRLYDLFEYIIDEENNIDNYASQIDVYNYLYESKDSETIKRLKSIVAYVPYRLLVDDKLMPILRGKTDRKKNMIIEQYTHVSEDTMYYISEKKIFLRDRYILDIKNNYFALINWINNIVITELR